MSVLSPDSNSLPETSPLFTVQNAARYQRRSFIQEIENATGRRLIVFYNSAGVSITQADTAPFQELLLDCDNQSDIDLLLQSPGGDIDAAEKLVYLLRSRAKSLRVIVADSAKSAATMMALAADEILMSATSELGPIDPQMPFLNAGGNYVFHPARSFLDGLEGIKQEVIANVRNGIVPELNPAYYPLLSQIDPALLDACNKAITRSRDFAEKWLVRHMLAHDHAKAKTIADALVDVSRYSSHGMVIDWNEARNLGLNATYIEADDEVWRRFWRLYLHYSVSASRDGSLRMFETRKISLVY